MSPSRTTNPAGAALVAGIEPQATVIDLVNLGPEHSRTVSARRHSAAFTAAFTAGSRRRLFILARAVGRAMLDRGHGKIIFTASLLSFQCGINMPGYAAVKAGVAAMTRALANEWHPAVSA